MIKIKGNYAEAVIYSDELDSGSEGQIETLCNINPNEPVICDTEKWWCREWMNLYRGL